MKTGKKVLAMVLVIAILMGFAMPISAAENQAAEYPEAAELLSHLSSHFDQDTDYSAPLTQFEANRIFNLLFDGGNESNNRYGGNGSDPAERHIYLAFLTAKVGYGEFGNTEIIFNNARDEGLFAGIGYDYVVDGSALTKGEAAQFLMNLMITNPWVATEFGVEHVVGTMDNFGRPSSKWVAVGTGSDITGTYAAPTAMKLSGDVNICNILLNMGYEHNVGPMYYFSSVTDGSAVNGPYYYCHWGDQSNGCMTTWFAQLGQNTEVYLVGNCQQDGLNEGPHYRIVVTTNYLAKVEDDFIQVYGNWHNDNPWGSWHSYDLPSNGYYIVNYYWYPNSSNTTSQGYEVVAPAGIMRGSLDGMDAGANILFVNNTASRIALHFNLGYGLVFGDKGFQDHFLAGERLTFFTDMNGTLIGCVDDIVTTSNICSEHEWSYSQLYTHMAHDPWGIEAYNVEEHERECTKCHFAETVPHNAVLQGYKEATEASAGYTGDIVCEDCGLILIAGSTIAPHRHSYSSEWDYDADVHWTNCVIDNCTHKANIEEHDWFLGECTVCGMREGESINPLWWLVIAGGASGCPFDDVPSNAWYREYVVDAYQEGLIDGMTKDTFAPNDNLTVAQAIKLAAVLYKKLNHDREYLANGEGKWYDTYVAYAVRNGIIESKYQSYTSSQMNAAVSRQEFVHILYGAAKNFGYYERNSVANNSIPDVKSGSAYASEIYAFYRAGILTGNDEAGTFRPTSNIKRSEVAAILVRMYDESARCTITLG